MASSQAAAGVLSCTPCAFSTAIVLLRGCPPSSTTFEPSHQTRTNATGPLPLLQHPSSQGHSSGGCPRRSTVEQARALPRPFGSERVLGNCRWLSCRKLWMAAAGGAASLTDVHDVCIAGRGAAYKNTGDGPNSANQQGSGTGKPEAAVTNRGVVNNDGDSGDSTLACGTPVQRTVLSTKNSNDKGGIPGATVAAVDGANGDSRPTVSNENAQESSTQISRALLIEVGSSAAELPASGGMIGCIYENPSIPTQLIRYFEVCGMIKYTK